MRVVVGLGVAVIPVRVVGVLVGMGHSTVVVLMAVMHMVVFVMMVMVPMAVIVPMDMGMVVGFAVVVVVMGMLMVMVMIMVMIMFVLDLVYLDVFAGTAAAFVTHGILQGSGMRFSDNHERYINNGFPSVKRSTILIFFRHRPHASIFNPIYIKPRTMLT